jgi:hypothetical protein
MGFVIRSRRARSATGRRGRTLRRRRTAALVVVASVAALSGSAVAERSQQGNVIVALDGGVTPRALPRNRRIPVKVHLGGRVLTSDHSPLPRVNWLRLEMAWRGVLDTRGLPICTAAQLSTSQTRQAMERCGGAEVGEGHLFAQIFVPSQPPFGVRAHLVAFNGRTKTGRRAVLVHAYVREPPVSFVIPFAVHQQPGSFRTVLVTTIRRAIGPWPHVAGFDLDVSRTFRYHGELHSYLNASCPIPPHFTAGFLSFARATYALSDGRKLKAEAVRSCRAR